MELRKVTMEDVVAGTDWTTLPVVFTGNSAECGKYACDRGYEWKPSRKYPCGGFWHRPAVANPPREAANLMPT